MKKHTLSLRRDALGELTCDELGAVAGAGISILPCIKLTELCPTWDCTGCYLTCGC